uniref:Uncharacterized protein n=1 Tax=Knipowitschia caucasica TaxID=637954 RepID=A0AAV2KWW9_KNICA
MRRLVQSHKSLVMSRAVSLIYILESSRMSSFSAPSLGLFVHYPHPHWSLSLTHSTLKIRHDSPFSRFHKSRLISPLVSRDSLLFSLSSARPIVLFSPPHPSPLSLCPHSRPLSVSHSTRPSPQWSHLPRSSSLLSLLLSPPTSSLTFSAHGLLSLSGLWARSPSSHTYPHTLSRLVYGLILSFTLHLVFPLSRLILSQFFIPLISTSPLTFSPSHSVILSTSLSLSLSATPLRLPSSLHLSILHSFLHPLLYLFLPLLPSISSISVLLSPSRLTSSFGPQPPPLTRLPSFSLACQPPRVACSPHSLSLSIRFSSLIHLSFTLILSSGLPPSAARSSSTLIPPLDVDRIPSSLAPLVGDRSSYSVHHLGHSSSLFYLTHSLYIHPSGLDPHSPDLPGRPRSFPLSTLQVSLHLKPLLRVLLFLNHLSHPSRVPIILLVILRIPRTRHSPQHPSSPPPSLYLSTSLSPLVLLFQSDLSLLKTSHLRSPSFFFLLHRSPSPSLSISRSRPSLWYPPASSSSTLISPASLSPSSLSSFPSSPLGLRLSLVSSSPQSLLSLSLGSFSPHHPLITNLSVLLSLLLRSSLSLLPWPLLIHWSLLFSSLPHPPSLFYRVSVSTDSTTHLLPSYSLPLFLSSRYHSFIPRGEGGGGGGGKKLHPRSTILSPLSFSSPYLHSSPSYLSSSSLSLPSSPSSSSSLISVLFLNISSFLSSSPLPPLLNLDHSLLSSSPPLSPVSRSSHSSFSSISLLKLLSFSPIVVHSFLPPALRLLGRPPQFSSRQLSLRLTPGLPLVAPPGNPGLFPRPTHIVSPLRLWYARSIRFSLSHTLPVRPPHLATSFALWSPSSQSRLHSLASSFRSLLSASPLPPPSSSVTASPTLPSISVRSPSTSTRVLTLCVPHSFLIQTFVCLSTALPATSPLLQPRPLNHLLASSISLTPPHAHFITPVSQNLVAPPSPSRILPTPILTNPLSPTRSARPLSIPPSPHCPARCQYARSRPCSLLSLPPISALLGSPSTLHSTLIQVSHPSSWSSPLVSTPQSPFNPSPSDLSTFLSVTPLLVFIRTFSSPCHSLWSHRLSSSSLSLLWSSITSSSLADPRLPRNSVFHILSSVCSPSTPSLSVPRSLVVSPPVSTVLPLLSLTQVHSPYPLSGVSDSSLIPSSLLTSLNPPSPSDFSYCREDSQTSLVSVQSSTLGVLQAVSSPPILSVDRLFVHVILLPQSREQISRRISLSSHVRPRPRLFFSPSLVTSISPQPSLRAYLAYPLVSLQLLVSSFSSPGSRQSSISPLGPLPGPALSLHLVRLLRPLTSSPLKILAPPVRLGF